MLKKILISTSLLFSAISYGQVTQISYWQNKTLQVSLSGKSSESYESNIVFNQMLQTTTPSDCSYYTEPQYYTITGTCYDLQCSGNS